MLCGLCKNLMFTFSSYPNPIFTSYAQFSGCLKKVYTTMFTFLRSVSCTLHSKNCYHIRARWFSRMRRADGLINWIPCCNERGPWASRNGTTLTGLSNGTEWVHVYYRRFAHTAIQTNPLDVPFEWRRRSTVSQPLLLHACLELYLAWFSMMSLKLNKRSNAFAQRSSKESQASFCTKKSKFLLVFSIAAPTTTAEYV